MSVRRLDPIQPEGFAFTEENLAWARTEMGKYPQGRQASAVISLLWRAQEQSGGWLPEPAIRYVADLLDMAHIRVLEVATFYTMFNLSPVGRYYVQLCGTTPCWLKGADDLKAVCRRVIGDQGHVTEDGLFSWIEVECLGACVNAPMVQINYDFYEDLTAESFERILNDFKAGKEPGPGPQVDRVNSAPEGGALTLTNPHLYDGNIRKLWAGEPIGDGDDQRPIKKAKPASVATEERKPRGSPRGPTAPKEDESDAEIAEVPGSGRHDGRAGRHETSE